MKHLLKIEPIFFDQLLKGLKTFEIRKNDRDYRVGDYVRLSEYDGGCFLGRDLDFLIVGVLTHNQFPDGLKDGYVILSLRRVYLPHPNQAFPF